MSKPTKLLVAFTTFWPAIYMIAFFIFVLVFFLSMLLNLPIEAETFHTLLVVLIPLHLLTFAIIVALGVFYIYHLFRNDRIAPETKPVRAVVLLMGNVISMPVYWYVHIRIKNTG